VQIIGDERPLLGRAVIDDIVEIAGVADIVVSTGHASRDH
jgi:hypothetical protein